MNVPARSSTGPGRTAFLLAQVGAHAAFRFGERVASLGLTPPQAGLLRAIGQHPDRSQQEVAAQLGLAPSRLVAMVDELEEAGLAERRRNPQDRRLYALNLTSTGRERLRDIGRIASTHGRDLLAPLADDERAQLHDLLQRLAAHHELAPDVHPGYRAMGPAQRSG